MPVRHTRLRCASRHTDGAARSGVTFLGVALAGVLAAAPAATPQTVADDPAASAGTTAGIPAPASVTAPGVPIDDPPPPVPPAVVTRDGGRATVRAIRPDDGACASTGGSTSRSTATVAPGLGVPPAAPRRGRAGDGTDRCLGDVRRRELLRLGPLLGQRSAEQVGGDRHAARLAQHAEQRPVRIPHRHLLRPAQRAALLREPARGLRRSADHQRGQPEPRLGTRCGTSGRTASTAGGRSRWSCRSSRCATGRPATRSGVSSSGAP